MIIFLILIIIIFLLIIIIYEEIRAIYYRKQGCYDIVGFPLIATPITLGFFDLKTAYRTSIKFARQHQDKPISAHIGPLTIIFVFQPKLFEILLPQMKLIDKSVEYGIFEKWLGTGLLTGTGDKWRHHRKILTPSFHYKILEDYVRVFEGAGNVFISKLKTQCLADNAFDVFEYATRYTLDVICETAMGINIDAQYNSNSDFVEAIMGMCDIFFKRTFVLPLRLDFIYRLTSIYQKEKRYLKVLHSLSDQVIQERKRILNEKNSNDAAESVDEDFGVKRRSNCIDVLLESKISDKDIIEEVNTFIFAGHESTAVTLSFALYELSKNPEIQQLAYEEIVSILSTDSKELATLEDLQQMKYLEMVIKETLRKYPPVPLFSRRVNEDIVFDDGKVFPKGIMLSFNVAALHNNTTLYPDPDRFDPERFSLENCMNRHPYAYLPFSAGPRYCIGQKFGILELKSSLSKVLREFRIVEASPDYSVQVTAFVILRSSNGWQIKLERR